MISPLQHEFAFYTTQVSRMAQERTHKTVHELSDPDLIHRLSVVLRFTKGQHVVLFDTHYHARCVLIAVDKKKLLIELYALEPNKQIKPPIIWALPLLKREAFAEALYTLVELGVQAIVPVITHKTQRDFGGDKELARAQKIILAAAEQSKNFACARIHPVVTLEQWIIYSSSSQATKLFFDAAGAPCASVISQLQKQIPVEIRALVGPEGDLTPSEKELLVHTGFVFCALTPTVLRAQQAVTVALGILRSLL